MTDTELMQSIKVKWGAAIAEAASTSSVPEAFLAALIANETGGNSDAKRFEHGVFASLSEVLQGRKTAYGSIQRSVLVNYVTGVASPSINGPAITDLSADALKRVNALATSWGLTQIMGYHILEGNAPVKTIAGLADAPTHLAMALRMLAGFAAQFQLDVTKDFEGMFRCWNGGHPTAATYDPQYVPNGLARMQEWATL
jgi:hypothetical protein